MIKIKNLCKSYTVSGNEVRVLRNLSLEIKDREKVAIVGLSGSGKSTLLNILAGLEKFDEGTVEVNNLDYNSVNSKVIDEMRLNSYGFIFQSFYLVETLNIYDNIVLPVLLKKSKVEKDYANELCEILDIKNRLNFYPEEEDKANLLSEGVGTFKLEDNTEWRDFSDGQKRISVCHYGVKIFNGQTSDIENFELYMKNGKKHTIKKGDMKERTYEYKSGITQLRFDESIDINEISYIKYNGKKYR